MYGHLDDWRDIWLHNSQYLNSVKVLDFIDKYSIYLCATDSSLLLMMVASIIRLTRKQKNHILIPAALFLSVYAISLFIEVKNGGY